MQSKDPNLFKRSQTISDIRKQKQDNKLMKNKNASSQYMSSIIEKYENKLEQKKAGLDYFKKKTKKLE